MAAGNSGKIAGSQDLLPHRAARSLPEGNILGCTTTILHIGFTAIISLQCYNCSCSGHFGVELYPVPGINTKLT